ncbi:hypothetical protein KEM55_000750, partial [Ascosphaera atra]
SRQPDYREAKPSLNYSTLRRHRDMMLQNNYVTRYLAQQGSDLQSFYQSGHFTTPSSNSCPPTSSGAFNPSPMQSVAWDVSPNFTAGDYAAASFAKDCGNNTNVPTNYCLPATATSAAAATTNYQGFDCTTNYFAPDALDAAYQTPMMAGSMATTPYSSYPCGYMFADSECDSNPSTATSTPESMYTQGEYSEGSKTSVSSEPMDEDGDELVGIGLYEDLEALAQEKKAQFWGATNPNDMYYGSPLAQPKRKMMKLEEAFDPAESKSSRNSPKSQDTHSAAQKSHQQTKASGSMHAPSSYYWPQIPSSHASSNSTLQNIAQSQQLVSQQQSWARSNVMAMPNAAFLMGGSQCQPMFG